MVSEEIMAEQDLVFVALRQHKTRNGRTRDGAQHAVIRDPALVAFLRRVLHGLAPDDLVFGSGPSRFKFLGRDFLGRLGTSGRAADEFPPSSLRTGGATWLYLVGCPRSEIQWRLRHGNEATGRHYIQQAGAALAEARVSVASSADLELFSSSAAGLIRSRGARAPPVLRRRLARIPPELRRLEAFDVDVFAGLG